MNKETLQADLEGVKELRKELAELLKEMDLLILELTDRLEHME